MIESGIKAGLETIGKSAAIATLHHIQTKFGLSLEDIPDHPDEFRRALRGIFGLGSIVLIQSIRDKLQTMSSASEEERKYLASFLKSFEEGSGTVKTGTL